MTSQQHIIARIPYFLVDQKIVFNEKVTNKTIHYIDLYNHHIKTAHDVFDLENIRDISYRPLSKNDGFLYLHTHQGTFPYKIEVNPKSFINTVFSQKSQL